MNRYALVVDGELKRHGILPPQARRLDTGEMVDLTDADEATREACGWVRVVDAPRPVDTLTTVHGRRVEMVDGVPMVVWPARQRTQEERARWQNSGRGPLLARIAAARKTNQDFLDAPSASPATVLAQVRELTEQMNAVLRSIASPD